MAHLSLKPTHKAVADYYDSLAAFDKLGVKHEMAVRSAFQALLEICGRECSWKLVPEYKFKGKGGKRCSADGALIDVYGLNHGLWEAKDEHDKLEKEIKAKFDRGYPKDNILFQEPRRAILYQQGQFVRDADLTKPEELVQILHAFLAYAPPALAEWERAVAEFKDRIPQIGESLKKLIDEQLQTNPKFIGAFTDFAELCRNSLNPNLADDAIEEMIIQHLLTERIFRKIFDFADFAQRNVIAQEIEKVAAALTSKSWSRDDFVKAVAPFYKAIEEAAATIDDFSEKQTFLNTVYERFFQGFCVKVADTHGIVYTPQPLVDFMVASVEEVLAQEFAASLTDKDVHILDPFTGTGNFIVNIMRFIAQKKKSALPHKYREELHCNEVMLLPYYVASMNIEHTYFEETGHSEPFEGVCLVDTFQTFEGDQGELVLFSEKNSARVMRQRKAPVRVVIANPPYNAGQVNENDNNKNRKYPKLDARVSSSYGDASKATLRRKLSDPYVKAIRAATDRIGDSGIVCFVNNNSFVTEKTFDGMRKELVQDFDLIYVLDLGGNVRKNPKLSGTTHNVFGIQVGVSINLFVRLPRPKGTRRKAVVRYHAVGGDWRRTEKCAFLEKAGSITGVEWDELSPDDRGNWITNDTDDEFAEFLPIGSKEAKAGGDTAIFKLYSLGVATNRDDWVYGFSKKEVAEKVGRMIANYNSEIHRYKAAKCPKDVDNFVNNDTSFVKWTDRLKESLSFCEEQKFDAKKIRRSLYRPFTGQWLYFDHLLNQRRYQQHYIYARPENETENLSIMSPANGGRSPFWCFATKTIPNLGFVSIDAPQCFPLFAYNEVGKARRDNLTTKAVTWFKIFYDTETATREDIFHYVYAMLHHPQYRERYAENLKRDLPRIPFVGVEAADGAASAARFYPLSVVEAPRRRAGRASQEFTHDPVASLTLFRQFVAAGKRLVDLHVHYESAKEHPLHRVENREAKLDFRVETMKLSKDKTSIIYNDFLTLSGIPPEVFDYRLGNRSALEWVIDQYRVTRDEHNKIVSDPNRHDDEEYIIRLIGQVVTVSMETLKTVKKLPTIGFS